MRSQLQDHVLHLTLGRPEKLNAMNSAEWEELADAVAVADQDPGVRVVVLSAKGRAFCAGTDLLDLLALTNSTEARNYLLGRLLPAFQAMATIRVPIVAAVQGLAYGAGLELLLFSDLVVAAEGASFRLPEVEAGVWPTVFVAVAEFTLGLQSSKWLALTGQALTAGQALSLGLVGRVVPDGALTAEVEQLAVKIATCPVPAVAAVKRFANHQLCDEGLPEVRRALERLADDVLFSSEARRRLELFAEGRTRP